MTKTTILATLFVVATLMIGTVSPAAFAEPIWTASGPGSIVTDADQNDGIVSFEYVSTTNVVNSWSFQTIATETDTVTLQYDWTGFHGFFGASTRLSSFGDGGSSLVVEGPVFDGSSPAGGFNYTGTVTLNLVAGEVYGFSLSGNSSDIDDRLFGTFIVTDVTVVENIPPTITAELVPLCGDDDDEEGLFMVMFTATDVDSTSLDVTAMLNGEKVTDGQIVSLELDDENEVEFEDGTLEIEAPSFELTVTADDGLTQTTATATPVFSNLVECDDDDSDDDDSDDDDSDDDDDDHDDDKDD